MSNKRKKGNAMSKMFFGGMPTELDRRKLRERFGIPQEGHEITHEEIG